MKEEKEIWEYEVDKADLKYPAVLKWYLERKIKMADWEGLDIKVLLENIDKLNVPHYRKEAIKSYFS